MNHVFFASLSLLEEEFGLSSWSARNWLGIGLYAVLFTFLLYVIFRIAQPAPDREGEGDSDDGTVGATDVVKEPSDGD